MNCVDLILYLFEIYGMILLLMIFDMWCTGVRISEIIGLIGLTCLWVFFILQYMYPYMYTILN